MQAVHDDKAAAPPTAPAKPLESQHAVITGGGRGIGAAVAVELAGLGAHLTLMGRGLEGLDATAERLRNDFAGEVRTIAGDVTDEDSVTTAFAQAADGLGPVSILVNNAGASESAPFTRTDLGLWSRMLDVNLTGVFMCTRTVVPAMLDAGGGRIVNVASTAGQIGYAYVSAYCAAKHGVIGLTRALAKELAASGITVNAVCPGFTETDMVADAIRNIRDKTGRSDEEAKAALAKTNPQGRLIQPEEVARVVGWLVAPGAGAVTGQAISVSGGEVMP